MDRGVLRRLMPITFNRTIPEKERIPHIGQQVIEEELDLVLAFAVQGAARLLERGQFPELTSSRDALQEGHRVPTRCLAGLRIGSGPLRLQWWERGATAAPEPDGL